MTEALLKLESKLKLERKELLLQKELLWLQKSIVDWLKSGDGNTRFFSHLNFGQKEKEHS